MERMNSIFSEFPYDLIVAIAKQIDSFNDFIAFGGVCRLWRSAAIEANKFDIGPSNCSSWPWLMLAENSNSGPGDDVSCARPFYSLSKGMSFKVNLPETKNKRCFASKGWLINIGKTYKNISIDLLHPLSRVQIKLPHLTSSLKHYQPNESEESEEEEDIEDLDDDGLLYAQFVNNVVLSSSSSSSAIIMVIYGNSSKLAFCNLGANVVEWIGIKTRPAMYFDVIHYRGHFYAIDCNGTIVVCDVTGTNPTVGNIVAKIPEELLRCENSEKLYLVESMGKLLVISREGVMLRLINKELINEKIYEWDGDYYTYGTTGFQIFEFDVSCGVWTEVSNLGDRALFLGHNSSFSIESGTINGVNPNCIYFTDDDIESYRLIDEGGGKDMGIYNLQDRSFTPHFNGKSCCPITPPMWIAL